MTCKTIIKRMKPACFFIGVVIFSTSLYLTGIKIGYATAAACQKITSAQTFPATESFGVPFDVFSATHQNLIEIICSAPQSTVRVGSGAANQYIYEAGYTYRNREWQREPLNGPNKVRNWLVGNATANIATSAETLPQTNFFVAYLCSYFNDRWYCGCKSNVDCVENRWNLQIFSGQPSTLTLPVMEFTQSISSIPQGGSVTLTWTASLADRCFGYGDWTGDKPFRGQETITNITRDQRYHLQCDGPGGSRMLLIQVWSLPAGAPGFTPVQ